jgi:hypothetical protein
MGKSLISAPMDVDFGETIISAVLSDPERRKEVDSILRDCHTQVRALLVSKRRVVEGVRDALLEREELIGDEIEVLMAELGEREPIDVPVAAIAGSGHDGPIPLGAGGNGQPGGNGHTAGSGSEPPPRPDQPEPR